VARALFTHCPLMLLLRQIQQSPEWQLSCTFWEGVVSWERPFPHWGTPRSRHLSPDQLVAADKT